MFCFSNMLLLPEILWFSSLYVRIYPKRCSISYHNPWKIVVWNSLCKSELDYRFQALSEWYRWRVLLYVSRVFSDYKPYLLRSAMMVWSLDAENLDCAIDNSSTHDNNKQFSGKGYCLITLDGSLSNQSMVVLGDSNSLLQVTDSLPVFYLFPISGNPVSSTERILLSRISTALTVNCYTKTFTKIMEILLQYKPVSEELICVLYCWPDNERWQRHFVFGHPKC